MSKSSIASAKSQSADSAAKKSKKLKGGVNNEQVQKQEEVKTKPINVQETVNEMMKKHGMNLVNRGDYPDLLQTVGLEAKQVTKKVLDEAKNVFKEYKEKKADKPAHNNSKLEWLLESKEEDWTTSKVNYWETVCGRYRAYQINGEEKVKYAGQYRNKKDWNACAKDSKLGEGYPKYNNTLEAALEVVEKFHSDRYAVVTLTSNKIELLKSLEGVAGVKKAKEGVKRSTTASKATNRVKEVDALGNRLGTEKAKINAALGSVPKTMKQLVDELELAGTCYNHINKLVKENKVKKTEEGYVLAV